MATVMSSSVHISTLGSKLEGECQSDWYTEQADTTCLYVNLYGQYVNLSHISHNYHSSSSHHHPSQNHSSPLTSSLITPCKITHHPLASLACNTYLYTCSVCVCVCTYNKLTNVRGMTHPHTHSLSQTTNNADQTTHGCRGTHHLRPWRRQICLQYVMWR